MLAVKHDVDIICLEETHVDSNAANRFSIDGFDLLSHVLHPKHGRATYVKNTITDAVPLESFPFCDVVQIGSYNVANIYKPPSESWDTLVLPALAHPAVYVGDFNSHHTD